jgi:hypothetical protein
MKRLWKIKSLLLSILRSITTTYAQQGHIGWTMNYMYICSVWKWMTFDHLGGAL